MKLYHFCIFFQFPYWFPVDQAPSSIFHMHWIHIFADQYPFAYHFSSQNHSTQSPIFPLRIYLEYLSSVMIISHISIDHLLQHFVHSCILPIIYRKIPLLFYQFSATLSFEIEWCLSCIYLSSPSSIWTMLATTIYL